MSGQVAGRLVVLVPAALLAFFFAAGLIVLIRPCLLRHAMARPNPRSSHDTPVPQGGGIAVVLATLAVTWAAVLLWPNLSHGQIQHFWIVVAAAILLTILGTIDDMHSLPATVRLIAQGIAVGDVMIALPDELRLLPQLPWWMDRACLLIAGVWFVNLVNFMDGIDWMTVAEFVPVTGAIVLLGLVGAVEPLPALVAAALVGAMVGFAPFNRPVAQVFLGDVGSLPLGLLLGWLLVELAAMGHLAAALILPLYYLADATITLALRIVRGEAFWQAHRTHFYQRATDHGLAVREIVTRVFLANLALAALALVTAVADNIVVSLAMLSAGTVMILWLLAVFAGVKNQR